MFTTETQSSRADAPLVQGTRLPPSREYLDRLFDALDRSDVGSEVSFREQVHAIHAFAREQNFQRILEVGLGIGGSAVHVLDATSGRLTTVDPHQRTLYKNRGIDNLQRAGFADRVEFFETYSALALAHLTAKNRQFDFIYIDGSHRFDDAFVDFYFADYLCPVGGYILLDDGLMPAVSRIAAFIETNRSENYERLPKLYPGGILFRKTVGFDSRKWDHYVEF